MTREIIGDEQRNCVKVGQFEVWPGNWVRDSGEAVVTHHKYTGHIRRSEYLMQNRPSLTKIFGRRKAIKDAREVLAMIEEKVPNINALVEADEQSKADERKSLGLE